METIALVISVLGSSVAATWVLQTKLSNIESTLRVHISSSDIKQEQLQNRIVKLERRKASR